jgi:hypothetical protein
MNINNEDLLEVINRLFERLHQMGGENFGSHITIVNVAEGAQYVNQIGTQIFGTDPSKKSKPDSSTINEPSQLPAPLATDEAMTLWKKAQEAGYVDDNYQPLISRTKAAMMANAMAVRLGLRTKWKLFETLWHRQNMYQDYYDAVNQQQSLDLQDRLDSLFG